MKQKKWKSYILIRSIQSLNLLLMSGLFAAAWFGFYRKRIQVGFCQKESAVFILLFLILYISFCRIYGGFSVFASRNSEIIYSQTLSCAITDLVMYLILGLLLQCIPNPVPLLLVLALQVVASGIWTGFTSRWYSNHFDKKRSAVIYDMRQGLERLIDENSLEENFDVVWVASVEDGLDHLSALDQLDVVFLLGVHSHDRNIILKYCIYRDIGVYVIPRIGDVIMSGAQPCHMAHLPMLYVNSYYPSPVYAFTKRLFDILLSSIAIIITSPIMLITAIAVRSDGGPVLYKQKRLTKDGKVFEILKFRSMRVDAEKDGIARLSTGEKDDRITPVGKIIRRIRIDELPQLFNILKNDMSIVGPRPERPEIAAQYETEMPEFRLRLQTKAGLTGYAQVYGKYNTMPYDKLLMDLTYIAKASLLADFKICLMTVKILFTPESTEGVAEGQTTAVQNAGKR